MSPLVDTQEEDERKVLNCETDFSCSTISLRDYSFLPKLSEQLNIFKSHS